MLELDFDGIRIQNNPREIAVHPIGHADLWADCRSGVSLIWAEGKVILMSTRFFPDAGCYVSALLMKFPDRPFPATKAEAIGIVKEAVRAFASGLLAAYPEQAPCRYCGGSVVDARCGSCGEADGV